MGSLSGKEWQEISPYLDEALSVPESDRAAWLAEFHRDRPDVAVLLEELLGEHAALSNEAFLSGRPLSPVETSFAGQTLGSYRLISPIGEGGMGTVWLAERSDGRFERKVAIKFLRFALGSQSGNERFKREGKILAQLSDPHIAELIDAGVTATGQPYIVLEYVEGKPIDAWCDEHRLDVNARISLFLDVLSAISHAHASLVVHRDIKPSNVLVRTDGCVKLLDFGIAKLLAGESEAGTVTQLTEGGSALTPRFAAPEQVTGGAITTATDVYGLGILLYLLLAGRHPTGTEALSPAELVRAITETDPMRLSEAGVTGETTAVALQRATTPERLRRELSGDLETIVAKALKKNPRERYTSVALLADDLRRWLNHEPISIRPDSRLYRLGKYVRRNRAGVAVAAALLVLLLSFAMVQTVQLRRIARERDRANRITEFMTDMFKMSDPSEARGNTVTVREILDKASKKIDPGLASDPALQAQMMHVMGDVYDDLGLYPTAESLLRRALEIQRRDLGPYARETLESKRLLGWILQEESKYADAEKLLRESLEDDRRTLGADDTETLSALGNLASTLFLERRYTESENLQREALTLAQRVLGPDNPKTLSSMNNLAAVIYVQRRYQEAEKLMRGALSIELRVLGTEDQLTLKTMDNLAMTLWDEGRYSEAEKLQREEFNTSLRVLGPEHPETLHAEDSLALLLKHQGNYGEAEKLFRQLLEVDRRVLGVRNRETLVCTYNLACNAALHGDRGEALAMLQDALDNGLVPLYGASLMEEDSDLASLRGDPRFKALIAKARKLEANHLSQ